MQGEGSVFVVNAGFGPYTVQSFFYLDSSGLIIA